MGYYRRILVIVTEDWFALSHFKNVLVDLRTLAAEVVVATRSSGRFADIEALGVRTRSLDMRRGSLNPIVHAEVRNSLARLIDSEQPDVVHAISMQSMIMTSLALRRTKHKPLTLLHHLVGLGYLGSSRSLLARMMRPLAYEALRQSTVNSGAWFLAENPDDIAYLVHQGIALAERTAVIPGAGIDLGSISPLPPPDNSTPRAAFVGRMLHSKGINTLVEAQGRLRSRGIDLDLAMYGTADGLSLQGISRKTLEEWNKRPGVQWHGHVSDILGVWRAADIAVVPSHGGEGMPRAMLEAAACGRPLIVADVPGCREFVRSGVEGFIVPPGDSEALAARLAQLAHDATLRIRQGVAARKRVVDQYSTSAVRASLFGAYGRASCGVGNSP